MHEDRSGREQPPEYPGAWSASPDGAEDQISPAAGDRDSQTAGSGSARPDTAETGSGSARPDSAQAGSGWARPDSAQTGSGWARPGSAETGSGWARPDTAETGSGWARPDTTETGSGWARPGSAETGGGWAAAGHAGTGGADIIGDAESAGGEGTDQPGGGYEYPPAAYPAAVYPGTPPPPPNPYGPAGGSGYGAGYPGAGYPGAGYPGTGYPGGGYPGGGHPRAGYQGGDHPGEGYPVWGYPGGYGYGGYLPGDAGYGMPGGYGAPGGYGGPGGGYGQERPKRAGRFITYLLVAALAAGVGAGTVLAMRHNDNASSSPGLRLPGAGAIPQPGSGSSGGSASRSTTQAVTNAVSPGIVDVISTPSFQPGGTLEGTGMILTSNGLVLTNNHVIEGTSHEMAKIANTGQEFSVTVLGTDATDDVALLKLNGASNLTKVPIGDSSTARVGQQVVALGNAQGQDGKPSVVTGTITSLNRSIQASDAGARTTENLHGMLQTDAPIVEGDSGGALASAQGKVIGMNTAANTGTAGAAGSSMGFAIPINRALDIARQIAAGHASSRIQIGYPAFLGVTVASGKSGPSTSASPQAQLRQLRQQVQRSQSGGFGGLGGNARGSSGGCLSTDQASAPSGAPNVSSGALVGGVLCGTPVDAAGMTAGAVITGISGHAITSPAALTKVLAGYHPGQTVSINWVSRSGQHRTSSVKLAAGPAK